MDLIVFFSHNKENYTEEGIKYLEVGNTEVVANIIHNLNNEHYPFYQFRVLNNLH